MTSQAVTDLMAARRHMTNVLLHLNVSAEDLTLLRFIELVEYFADNPTEYLDICKQNQ